MLMPSSEGERYDTHSCALPPLSHRPGHEGWQDQSAHLKHDPSGTSRVASGCGYVDCMLRRFSPTCTILQQYKRHTRFPCSAGLDRRLLDQRGQAPAGPRRSPERPHFSTRSPGLACPAASTWRPAVQPPPAAALTMPPAAERRGDYGAMPSNVAAVSPNIARRSSSVKPGALRM
jgi:hypothetical protein